MSANTIRVLRSISVLRYGGYFVTYILHTYANIWIYMCMSIFFYGQKTIHIIKKYGSIYRYVCMDIFKYAGPSKTDYPSYKSHSVLFTNPSVLEEIQQMGRFFMPPGCNIYIYSYLLLYHIYNLSYILIISNHV